MVRSVGRLAKQRRTQRHAIGPMEGSVFTTGIPLFDFGRQELIVFWVYTAAPGQVRSMTDWLTRAMWKCPSTSRSMTSQKGLPLAILKCVLWPQKKKGVCSPLALNLQKTSSPKSIEQSVSPQLLIGRVIGNWPDSPDHPYRQFPPKFGTMRGTNLRRWAVAVEAGRTREEDGHEQR